MQTSIANQNFSSDDPLWYLLAEFSLSELLSNDDLMAGLLFQAAQELGMSPQCTENIISTLAELVRTKQRGLEFPGRIRIFCQKKMIDDANAGRATSRPYHTEPAMEHSPMILDFDTKMNGGWGCFLIKRGDNVSDDAAPSSQHVVDLYLYKEG